MTLSAGADRPGSEHPTMIYLDDVGIAVVSSPALSWEQRVEYARLFAASADLLNACDEIMSALMALPVKVKFAMGPIPCEFKVKELRDVVDAARKKARGTK